MRGSLENTFPMSFDKNWAARKKNNKIPYYTKTGKKYIEQIYIGNVEKILISQIFQAEYLEHIL